MLAEGVLTIFNNWLPFLDIKWLVQLSLFSSKQAGGKMKVELFKNVFKMLPFILNLIESVSTLPQGQLPGALY